MAADKQLLSVPQGGFYLVQVLVAFFVGLLRRGIEWAGYCVFFWQFVFVKWWSVDADSKFFQAPPQVFEVEDLRLLQCVLSTFLFKGCPEFLSLLFFHWTLSTLLLLQLLHKIDRLGLFLGSL